MSKRASTLYARVKQSRAKYSWVPVTFTDLGHGIVLPSYPSEATSFVFKGWPAGAEKIMVKGVTFDEGMALMRQTGAIPSNLPIQPPSNDPYRPTIATTAPTAKQNDVLIAASVEKFLADLPTKRNRHGEKLAISTLKAYTNAVIAFRDHCGVAYMSEITQEVLLAHREWLYANLKKRSTGKMATTVANRFRFLNIWLHANGIKAAKGYNPTTNDPGLMNWSEFPSVPKSNGGPNKYSDEQIKTLLSVATDDEADLIHFFLRLGVRDEEAAYAMWSDIDWKNSSFHIQEKPEYGWRTKDKEDRWIPFNGVLGLLLTARQTRQDPKSKLIFPSKGGKPDMHLIRRLHNVAERAGHTERVTLHRFRRTFASKMIAKTDLQTVQKLLGHSDIKTTSLYLAADEASARRAVAEVFEDATS